MRSRGRTDGAGARSARDGERPGAPVSGSSHVSGRVALAVTTLRVAGALTSVVSTFEALSTVTSALTRYGSSGFAGSSGGWPPGGACARRGEAASAPIPARARSPRFIVVLLEKGSVPPALPGRRRRLRDSRTDSRG